MRTNQTTAYQGFQDIVDHYERARLTQPKGVTLAKKGNQIYLQFKSPAGIRGKYSCDSQLTHLGIDSALSKAHLVANRLKEGGSESSFWEWYDFTIRNTAKQFEQDAITWQEAIDKVKKEFFSRRDRRGYNRQENIVNAEVSWDKTYGRFYQKANLQERIDLDSCQAILRNWQPTTRSYKDCLAALRHLAEVLNKSDLLKQLPDKAPRITKKPNYQSISIDEFVEMIEKSRSMDSKQHLRYASERECWLWAMGVQIIYGLRACEIWAVQNWEQDCTLPDETILPAYNSPTNPKHLIYIGQRTAIGTTVKTGDRVAIPLILVPSKLSEIINFLEPKLPNTKPKETTSSECKVNFYSRMLGHKLEKWSEKFLGKKFTQTHAFRHTGNLEGMSNGIPIEIRAQSMGHSSA